VEIYKALGAFADADEVLGDNYSNRHFVAPENLEKLLWVLRLVINTPTF